MGWRAGSSINPSRGPRPGRSDRSACSHLLFAGRIDGAKQYLNPAGFACFGARAGRLLDAMAALITAVVMAAFGWQFLVFAGKIARAGETTWILKIPTAPFWYGVCAILRWRLRCR